MAVNPRSSAFISGFDGKARVVDMKAYWDKRYRDEGRIWGDSPSTTAAYALELFRRHNVETVLIPGAGYGRNSKLFSASDFEVTGVEISGVACGLAKEYDPHSKFCHGSALDMSFDDNLYDAVYCYNVLHLFRERERRLFLDECDGKLRNGGLLFFTVFSDREPSFGKCEEVEEGTFESKPGRPVHYFTEEELRNHFSRFETLEAGIAEDPEDHGEGPHTHILRYIFARKSSKVI